MKDIYTSDELWDEVKRLREENEFLRGLLNHISSLASEYISRVISQQEKEATKNANKKALFEKNRKAAVKSRVKRSPLPPRTPPTLRKEREAAGLNLKTVAQRMKVSIGYLSELETGKRPLFMPDIINFRKALKGK